MRTDDLPTLDASGPLESLPGISNARSAKLRELGLTSIRDLIEYFPRRYQFEAQELPISQLQPDQIHTVRGTVTACDYLQGARGGRFEATLDDGSETLSLVWFNGHWVRRQVTPGALIRVRGKVKFFRGIPQMANAQLQIIDADTPEIDTANFRPIYPATAELASKAMEKIIDGSLDKIVPALPEWFDGELLARRRLIERPKAYLHIHRPGNYAQAYQAHRRLVYDELMLLQLGLGLSRRAAGGRLSAPVVRVDKLLDQRIRKRFPFAMTDAQERTAWEIVRDMQSGTAMNRLLQGDVGSGKTAVALYAMLVCVANKLQAVLLAPTEVLAEQHYISLSRFLDGSGVRVGLFTQRSKKADKTLRDGLREGDIHLAVGTQALIQHDIDFANLGLVVVDEQHRFGVRQRATLKDKGLSPHYLVMTATPIPRTLALSYFADFDVSTIDQLPPGRQPITTTWLRRDQAMLAHAQINRDVAAGRQAYVVVPKIDGDGEDVASLTAIFESLSQGPLKSLRLLMLHGRMSSQQKQQTMQQFRDRQADVLVATTVIEVGVDVPNATVMLIESAEQFGLAQLHQLRGRVGRGGEASTCILLSDAPTPDAAERMRVMCETTDGFALAEADLKMRGPGDFFGTRQSGLPQLKIADLTQELEMLKLCRDDAQEILQKDPDLRLVQHAALRAELIRRFGDTIGLASVG